MAPSPSTSTSGNKNKLLKTVQKASCGGCGRLKPSDVHDPISSLPKPKTKTKTNTTNTNIIYLKEDSISNTTCSFSISYNYDDDNDNSRSFSLLVNEESCTESTDNNTFSIHNNNNNNINSESDETVNLKAKSPSIKINDSIAVVKDSNDPNQDFKHSMLQMIFEKEIYSKNDLQELLNCFLQLNSPSHHGIILQAFTEIWNDVISRKPTVNTQKP